MHGLGIPTTRTLCLIGNNDEIYREQIETAAIVTRLAPSHIRFDSFETFFYRNQIEWVKTLADFVIQHHYPELKNTSNPYLELLNTVIDKTAKLITQWQAVGFAHGVMNTDNMSVLGLTLDYGPFGFLDAYDCKSICNHSDYEERYTFEQQPQIGLFNLSCFAQALLPLLDVELAQAALATYQGIYTDYYNTLMAQKLGFRESDNTVIALQENLLEQMQQGHVDYTLFFRQLSCTPSSTKSKHTKSLRDMFINGNQFDSWLTDYNQHMQSLSLSLAEQQKKMRKINPKFILRNYMAQIAIEKAEHEHDYAEMQHYADLPPNWANALSVSCSS